MNRKQLVITFSSLLLVVVVAIGYHFYRTVSTPLTEPAKEYDLPTEEPIDIALDFYDTWFKMRKESAEMPEQTELTHALVLTPELSERLTSALADTTSNLDPVLCQNEVPEKIGTKKLFVQPDRAQFLIIARGKILPGQAVVTLETREGEWRITDISCSQGETAPVREFSFEKTGFLLKSVPPPLNPEYWHLVFEENGQMGHTAPLFFSDASTWTLSDGTEQTCDPNQFTDALQANVKGEMTEAGVEVKRLEILE